MKAVIRAIEYHLPSDTLTNADLSAQFPDWSVDRIASKTGIRTRHIADEATTSGDLAVEAARKLFANHGISPSEIDFVLFCTQSPDYFLPTTACLIQDRLGIPTTAGALDFNLGCSGYIYGLSLAKGLIQSGEARNVLLLTGETYSKFIQDDDRSVRTLFGDAGAATLVSADARGLEIGAFVYGTDGSGARSLIVENGAARASDKVGSSQLSRLFMDGPEIFRFTLASIPGLVNGLLQKRGWSIEEVDLFVFHQANRFMLHALRDKLKIPASKFYEHLEDCGNTVSCTIPIALQQALKEREFETGSRLVLVGFGVGYSWGACTLTT